MFKPLFRRAPGTSREVRKPSIPEGQRVYAIGDIHGRADLLDRIHRLIEADMEGARAEARIVYLGDYVDRGPDSAGVLERLTGRGPRGLPRLALKGNHEDMLLRFLADASSGAAWRQLGGLATLMSYRVDVSAVLAKDGFAGLSRDLGEKIPPHHLEMLRGLGTHAAVGDYFFCHAGVRPGAPLERQRERDLLWIRDEFLSSTADFGKVVVHGHSPADAPEIRSNRIGIDTGAYATGRLTCLVLEGAERRFLST